MLQLPRVNLRLHNEKFLRRNWRQYSGQRHDRGKHARLAGRTHGPSTSKDPILVPGLLMPDWKQAKDPERPAVMLDFSGSSCGNPSKIQIHQETGRYVFMIRMNWPLANHRRHALETGRPVFEDEP
jgi:hypothetical protein